MQEKDNTLAQFLDTKIHAGIPHLLKQICQLNLAVLAPENNLHFWNFSTELIRKKILRKSTSST